MKRSWINKRGKKTLEWARVRRELKVKFEAMGVTRCEIRLPGCMVNFGLSFAHASKRTRLVSGATKDSAESIYFVALSCAHCHQVVEQLKPAIMRKIVSKAVLNRSAIQS